MSYAEVIERYNYSDYVKWEGDWELVDGIPLAMAPAPIITHQAISGAFLRELMDILDECKECMAVSEIDFKIKDDTVLRPDVLVICDEFDKAYISKAPKLIAEVISPSSAKRDEKLKFGIYEEEGVGYYILIYPDDLVAKVYKLKDNKYQKIGDFTKEKCEFKIDECGEFEVDFNRVFKRFRK